MNNDIVNRLRNGLFREENACGEYGCVTHESDLTNRDLVEAADEIDRLRIELDIYKRLYAEELVRKALENNGL